MGLRLGLHPPRVDQPTASPVVHREAAIAIEEIKVSLVAELGVAAKRGSPRQHPRCRQVGRQRPPAHDRVYRLSTTTTPPFTTTFVFSMCQ